MYSLVIIADDLSGAADCGIACVHHGLNTLVTFGNTTAPIGIDVIAIDSDTRSLSSEEAGQRTAAIVRGAAQSDQQLLFKKLDSTLRGHAATELAATLYTRRATTSRRTVVVLAPAFPANGRTTLHGHQLLHGKHLHETELGEREGMTGKCDLAAMMQAVGLSTAVVPLSLIRSSQPELQSTLHQLSISNDVLICDAETDFDLRRIAASAITLGPSTIWAGCAGLAHHLPKATGLSRSLPPAALPRLSTRPSLLVIGSTSTITRNQIEYLLAVSPVAAITLSPQTLLDGPSSPAWKQAQTSISSALAAQRDTAILLDNANLLDKQIAPQLARAIGQLLAPCHTSVGALVATGGETARAVMEAWGVSALRLLRELEPGLPLSLTEGWNRPLPVITKAGAFGNQTTLFNCLQTLHALASIQ